jgi:hypothetical protein
MSDRKDKSIADKLKEAEGVLDRCRERYPDRVEDQEDVVLALQKQLKEEQEAIKPHSA